VALASELWAERPAACAPAADEALALIFARLAP
jgi:hypothetical protein